MTARTKAPRDLTAPTRQPSGESAGLPTSGPMGPLDPHGPTVGAGLAPPASSPPEQHATETGPISLAALLPILQRAPAFEELQRSVAGARPGGDPSRLSVVAVSLKKKIAALHAALGRTLVLLTARPGTARQLWEDLLAWAENPADILHFPAPDALPYEKLPEDPSLVARRVDVLARLGEAGNPPLVVACLRAVMDHLDPPDHFRAASRVLKLGDRVSMSALLGSWIEAGYESGPLVDGPGQVSRRGGILDVYPPSGPATRIELFGDEIESIRVFDVETQRSGQRLTELRVTPASERPSDDPAAPIATFFDHLPEDAIVMVDEGYQIEMVSRDLEAQAEEVRMRLQLLGEVPAEAVKAYQTWPELRSRLGTVTPRVLVDMTHDPGRELLPFVHAPAFAGRLKAFLDRVARPAVRGGESIVVVSLQSARLQELLGERNVEIAPTVRLPADWAQPAPEGRLALVHGSLPEGWRCEALGLSVFTDGELFGWRKVRRPARQTRTAARDAFLSDLQPGELVVHVDHGIGRFRGLYRTGGTDTEHGTGNAIREFLLIEYDGQDRLYVPSDQADRVTRYVGGGDEAPNLTRLGTQEWTRAKARARRAVRDIAKDLVELYAARKLAGGHAFSPDTTWQRELEDSFPYAETPDQLTAIAEVKADMEGSVPMDRLLVGDVGYGKTEVALRAAFKAVMDG